MPSRRQFLALLPAVLAASSIPALAGETTVAGGAAFGSYWRLTLPAGTDGRPAARAIEAVVGAVDRTFSPWRDDSEITGFNRHRGTDALPLSADAMRVVEAALGVAHQSGGAFDPTVGPAVARHGFGPIANAISGSHRQIGTGADGVRKSDPRLSLDLCGIAKGHALDRIVTALDRLGLDAYLVDLGGEVFARGAHPSGRPWRLAVEPGAEAEGMVSVVALADRAIATSGLAAQGGDPGGVRFGHIIDPANDRPTTTDAVSVSVLSASAMMADAWATALMAMPADAAFALAGRSGLDALFILRREGGTRRVTTGRFAEILLA